jgi:hypothetical protein
MRAECLRNGTKEKNADEEYKLKNAIFGVIAEGASEPLELLCRLLFTRGFFVERDEKGIVISDNAYDEARAWGVRNKKRAKSDWKDLLSLVGKMVCLDEEDGSRIVACKDNFSPERVYKKLFTENARIACEVVWYDYIFKFNRFRREGFPAKLRTIDIEPFVALYVKACGAAKIVTLMSCQGHLDDQRFHRDDLLSIDFVGEYNGAFHKTLWEVDENLKTMDLHWKHSGYIVYIQLEKSNVDKIYTSLIRAGKYIYENRDKIREMKALVVKEMTKNKGYQELEGEALTNMMKDVLETRGNRFEKISLPGHFCGQQF